MPADRTAVMAERITKTYRSGVGRARVREMIPPPFDALARRILPRWWSKDTFNALEEISLSISAGSSVGLVGPNGAGKTTLLKVIAGVTAPSGGKVSVQGRVAALIDLLVGFHPDLTGRENAYVLASMHGVPRREMNARIDRVLDFTENPRAADTPLKRYSAGMAARLAFATLVALEADILLVDEVLSVGDAAFQQKCVRWLDEHRAKGRTLVVVSHNLGLIRSMTDRVVWIERGRVMEEGPTGEVLAAYARSADLRDTHMSADSRRGAHKLMRRSGLFRWGAGGARIDRADVHYEEDDSELTVSISYEPPELDRAVFCVGFVDESEREVAVASSSPVSLSPSGGSITCRVRPLPLRAGIYFPVVGMVTLDGRVRDRWRLDRAVVVEPDGVDMSAIHALGPVAISADWSDAAPNRRTASS